MGFAHNLIHIKCAEVQRPWRDGRGRRAHAGVAPTMYGKTRQIAAIAVFLLKAKIPL
jgi:hypothetical protein